MATSVISCIDAALHHLHSLLPVNSQVRFSDELFSRLCELKIGLRNIKAMVLCIRSVLGDDADGRLRSSSWGPQLSRIEDQVGRIPSEIQFDSGVSYHFTPRLMEVVDDIHDFARVLDDCYIRVLYNTRNYIALLAGDVVEIADSILDNAADFLALIQKSLIFVPLRVEAEAIDDMEVQVTFLKNLLLFAMRTGVEQDQFQNLLIAIAPFAINAVWIFINTGDIKDWFEHVKFECLVLKSRVIDPKIYQAYATALSTSKLSIDDDGILHVLKNFLSSILSVLWEVLRLDACHLVSLKDQLKVLYERLRLCRTILRQCPKNIDEIGVLIRDAGMLICSLHQTEEEVCPGILRLLERFDVIQAQVENKALNLDANSVKNVIKGSVKTADLPKISYGGERDNQAVARPQSTPQFVGFQDEVASIMDRLTRGSKKLRRVVISGMAGVGKTTLALKVYNHPCIMHHFHVRAWWPISQVLDKKNVLLQLLNQIDSESFNMNMSEEDLANKLRQSLKGKRYLIFLDDVWTVEALDSLRLSFPDDSTHSRIILTSRQCNITLDGEEPQWLRLRTDDECLEILQAKLFPKEGWPVDLNELGMKIAEKCRGLPLTAVIVAGILETVEQEDWKGVLDALSSGAVSSSEQCMNTLELSYNHLPIYLQLCFLYFGVFPEDQKVSVRRLIRLWIAEGFVRNESLKRIEDVAREYLEMLIKRSLVIVAGNRSTGGVKTCRIHDLLRDFCLAKAKQENFFHLLQGHDLLYEFNETCYLQRLCIYSDLVHFKKSRLFCPHARSLLFFFTRKSVWYDLCLFDLHFIIQIFKLLNVLDIELIPLTFGLPREIELLIQLKYLSINQGSVDVIPSSVGNLSNLETFIVCFRSKNAISLPPIWNLRKLKYLYIRNSYDGGHGFTLPSENLGNSILLELDTLSGVVFDSTFSMMQMRKLPNIRRLKFLSSQNGKFRNIRRLKFPSSQNGKSSVIPVVNLITQHVSESTKEQLRKSHLKMPSATGSTGKGSEGKKELNEIVVPDFLSQLESLSISGGGKLVCQFGSTRNLKKVTLHGFKLSREEITVIGKFPVLEVLKLERITFLRYSLEMEEGEFTKLRILKLFHCNSLRRWIASDEQLPCLEKLILGYCTKLKEIPSCLETIPTLEEIEVHCSQTVESSVRHIEEVQKDFGNLIKVIVKNIESRSF